ncbi:unnamed protein product [Somion occarium]|uniref:NUDE domain-containing protein n=1 Tax=Somion occarium TaxID=3059160 RepID=A0ABP1CLA3_9APHY
MTAVLQATDAFRNDRLMAPHDDINYSSSGDWKAKYMEVADMLAETRAELDDFHASSKDLEEELERELERTEKAQRELKVKVAKAEHEKDEWKSKFVSLQTLHNTTTTSLQRELDTLRQDYQKIKIQLRELEMGNDDLERNERAISSSLADAEQKYSRVLEEKILLEHELLDKANLEEESQRLKDELRDANEEIVILKEQLSTALQRNVFTTDITYSAPPSIVSHSENESLLSTPAPPDLELSDLTPPPETPAKDFPPVTTKAHRNSEPINTSPSGQASLLHRAGFQPPRAGHSSPPSGIPSHLTRSSTVPTSMGSPRTPSSRPATNRVASTMSSTSTVTGVPGTTTKSRGVQMVSEMRARVKVLEQKIHTRVPRLRMGSVTNRASANAMPPPKAGPSTSMPSPAPSTSSSSLKTNSSDGRSGVKNRRQSIESEGDKHTPIRDSSGWVMITEVSPSPVKDIEKERRRTSVPAAPSAFRPLSSTSASPSPSTSSRPPSALSQSVAPTRRSQSRLSVSTEGRSSISTNATTSTASSIPTPTSRPATPTFLPVPSSGMYHSSIAQKRSAGPASGAYNQKKRSSFGSIRPNAKVSQSPSFAQSRIGRPGGSPRKSIGDGGTESDTTTLRIGRGRAGTASALFGRSPF